MGETAMVEIMMRNRPLDRELGGEGMLAVGNGLEQVFLHPDSRRLYTASGELLGTTEDDPLVLGERVESEITGIARRIYTDRSGEECLVDGVRFATFDLLCKKADADRARVALTTSEGEPCELTAAIGLQRHLYLLARQEHALECMVEPITLRYVDLLGRRSRLVGTLHRVVPLSTEDLVTRGITSWARSSDSRDGPAVP
jgi:hypothetical protein